MDNKVHAAVLSLLTINYKLSAILNVSCIFNDPAYVLLVILHGS